MRHKCRYMIGAPQGTYHMGTITVQSMRPFFSKPKLIQLFARSGHSSNVQPTLLRRNDIPDLMKIVCRKHGDFLKSFTQWKSDFKGLQTFHMNAIGSIQVFLRPNLLFHLNRLAKNQHFCKRSNQQISFCYISPLLQKSSHSIMYSLHFRYCNILATWKTVFSNRFLSE